MSNHPSEMERMFSQLVEINATEVAEADALMNWECRELVVLVDENGKFTYAATLQIDSPAIEAKCRLIRHELEQLVAQSEMKVAA